MKNDLCIYWCTLHSSAQTFSAQAQHIGVVESFAPRQHQVSCGKAYKPNVWNEAGFSSLSRANGLWLDF